MFKGLSLDQAPPFEAPLLFLLTAPLWGISGGLALLFAQIQPQQVGVLHLFTLGFMAQVMIGALQQMLPVVVGVRFPKPTLLSKLIFAPLALGIALFFIAFFGQNFSLLFFAASLLLLALWGFGTITLWRLFQAPKATPTVWAMRLSLLSLLLAAGLGTHMAVGFAQGSLGGSFDALLLIHALFAVFGWVGLLIVGVSYQVVPMFYVTPEPTERFRKWLVWILFGLLIATAAALFFSKKLALALFVTLLFGYLLYGAWTLQLLQKRKRKIWEVSLYYWYLGLVSLFFLPLVWFFDPERFGILFLFGFAISIMIGMLYKIIPFLSWFHTSSRGFFDMPTMKEMIEEKKALVQFGLHLLALIALLLWPKAAAPFLVLSFGLLLWLLSKPVQIYFEYKKKPSPFENFQKGCD